MLSLSRNVNTSIESCVTHLLRWKESQSQSEKDAVRERALITPNNFKDNNYLYLAKAKHQRQGFLNLEEKHFGQDILVLGLFILLLDYSMLIWKLLWQYSQKDVLYECTINAKNNIIFNVQVAKNTFVLETLIL